MKLKLIKIQDEFTTSQKEKILRSVEAGVSENLLHSVQFGKKAIFAMCESSFFWHCDFNETKTYFECYESQGKIDRNKNLPTTIIFEDQTEKHGKKQKPFTTLILKNDHLTRRFDLNFVLTEEEKIGLKYYFECYFKYEEVSENFKMPKEKIGRVIGLKKEAFYERVENFFGKTDKEENSDSEDKKSDTVSDEKTAKNKKSGQKSIGRILNFIDFFADIAFLFAAVSLIKWDGISDFKQTAFSLGESTIDKQEFFLSISLSTFSIFKLLVTLISKDSLKIPGLLLLVIQGATLFLLSDFMSQTPLMHSIIFFVILNILLYFCFQMFVGNIFKTAIQKWLALLVCGVVLYLGFTTIQTIDMKTFVNNLLNK